MVNDRTHPTYQIVTSFLLDSTAWQSIGDDASQDVVLAKYGGLLLRNADSLENAVPNPGAAAVLGAPEQGNLVWNSEGVFFADLLPAGQYQLRVDGSTYPLPVASGGHFALEVKPGPQINLVAPSAGNLSTLDRAPGMSIAIYGSNLLNAAVTIGGISCVTQFNSGSQINTVIPSQLTGLVQVSVANAMGQDSLNILLAPAVPAIFSADGSGTGTILALHATDSSPLSSSNTAHVGETISIFLTGLGVPAQTPILQLNDSPVSVTGISPLDGSPGVVQLDFTVPALSAPIQVKATIGTFSSNLLTLPSSP